MADPGADPERLLLKRCAARLRRRRALGLALSGAWAAAAVAVAHEVAARFLVLPDLRLLLAAGVLGLPALLAAWAFSRPVAPATVALEAGRLAGAGALFLAAKDARGLWAPLLQHRARVAARSALARGLPRPPWPPAARFLPPVLLVTALLLAAPGRRVPPPDLEPAARQALAREGRAARTALQGAELGAGQRASLEAALLQLEEASPDAGELARLKAQLQRAAREAGGDAGLLAHRLSGDPLLDPLAAAVRSGSRERLAGAVRALLRRFQEEGLPPYEAEAASRRLVTLSREVSDPALAAALREAGVALGAGTGAGTREAVAALGEEIPVLPGPARKLLALSVHLEAAAPGGAAPPRAARPPVQGAAPAPARRTGAPPVPGGTLRYRESARHETILRNYFAWSETGSGGR